MLKPLTSWGAALAVMALTGAAWALPSEVSSSDTDRGASITLETWEQVILGDETSRCLVSFVVTDDELAFTQGDQIIVKVYEDDVIGDELLWQETINVSQAQINAGRVEATLDCSSQFGEDQFGQIEIYAELVAVKEECGFFCFSYESPRTPIIPLTEVEDDDHEPDDIVVQAVTIVPGVRDDLIAADEDWAEVQITDGISNLRYLVTHDPSVGPLDVSLLNERGDRIATGDFQPGGFTLLSADDLAVGLYRLLVKPRISNDPNFYDAQLRLELSDQSCIPGEEERLPCGDCGNTVRVCGNDGRWGEFDGCAGEGECSPGDARASVCGNCGQAPEICNDQCQWENAGACRDEGICERGRTDRLQCADGFQFRTCDDSCQWGDFGPCVGEECQDGEVRVCYEGPDGTEDVGVCQGGRQFCDDGRWSTCVGQIVPFDERCADGQDNDCDGLTDEQDVDDCQDSGAELGSACVLSSECKGQLDCLINQFLGGYCGLEGCANDSQCGPQGVCGSVFGQDYCLLSCTSDAQCRTSYICAEVGPGARGCVPRCTGDDACTDPAARFCNGSTGLCQATAPNNNPGNNNPNNDPGNNDLPNNDAPNNDPNNGFTETPTGGGGGGGGGCATPAAPIGGAGLPLGLLLLGLALWRRRD